MLRTRSILRLGLMTLVHLLVQQSQAHALPLRIEFVGDIMLDGGPGHLISNGDDPFAHVSGLLRDADITVGNLECAIATEGHAVDKVYTFLGRASAVPMLKDYFSAVSIANNHSGDWGKAGLSSQLELMSKAQLPWFGGGANLEQAHRPLIISRHGHRVALLGYNEFPPREFEATATTPGTAWLVEADVIADIRRAKREGHADIVIPFLHWGKEFETTPEQSQQLMARRFIDAGASAIIGAHPHVTQTIEWYKGRPIVYSLGNFAFDYAPGDPPKWYGWVVRLSFAEYSTPGLEVFPVVLDLAGVPFLSKSP
jgi:poly-gamma-glutamate capsule biosynthesis protein CapA/YwtB (metallophosphatase superfamily)